MLTYQDFKSSASDVESFIIKLVSEHKSSNAYAIAQTAELYNRQLNATILNYQKYLYKLSGEKVTDVISPNYKLASNYLNRFVTQLNQYLLGNGVTFDKPATKKTLGLDFDTQLQRAGYSALIQGVSFGFWDFDRLRVFKFTEFAPLYDEENGALRAGVRFWQLSSEKPTRFTLYEEDGYTEYIKRKDEQITIIAPKRAYKQIVTTNVLYGEDIKDGENYPGFPIVPLYSNPEKQSVLVGLRPGIDAYDLIKSGFANDLDGHMLYWLINNAGGMDDVDIARLMERIKTLGAVITDDEANIESKEITIPHESRIAYLNKLEDDLYKDFGALKVENLSSSSVTATQIIAAYQPLDCRADQYEYECIDFIRNILALQGIDDMPQFKRNRIANQAEEISMILQSASYLDDETILNHLPFLSPDEVKKILKNKEKEEAERFTLTENQPQNDQENQEETDSEEETEEVEENEKVDETEGEQPEEENEEKENEEEDKEEDKNKQKEKKKKGNEQK